MSIEGALTSQSSVKCHVTMDSGYAIVSWEQQEQECQKSACYTAEMSWTLL